MKKFVLVTIICLFQAVAFAQSISEKLDEYLKAAEKAGIFNGSVLVVQKGITLLNKGYGFKNAETKTLNDSNTIFQIGSVTKQFTSAIILKLAEQNKLTLQDKLSKYFPDLSFADKITIEQLLSHTSGIFNYTNDTAFIRTGSDQPADRQKIFSLFKDKPLDFEPGSKFSYTNSGYMLLGYIIEKVTGKKYEEVVRNYIFNPLGMTHSGFDFKRLQSPDKATGYYVLSGNVVIQAKAVDSSVSFSAGAMYSTTGDLFKWNQSLSTQKILSSRSLQNAFTPRLSKYAFGWFVDSVYGQRIINHGGLVDGFLAYNTIIPADDVSITILSNLSTDQLSPVAKAVFAILYNKPYKLPEIEKEIQVDSSILKRYVGEYELAPTFRITVAFSDGKLKAQATGQPVFELYAEKENVFFLKVVKAKVEFVIGTDGQTESLILYQNGQTIPGKKIK